MKHAALAVTTSTLLIGTACARGSRAPTVDPATLASLHSEMRLVERDDLGRARCGI